MQAHLKKTHAGLKIHVVLSKQHGGPRGHEMAQAPAPRSNGSDSSASAGGVAASPACAAAGVTPPAAWMLLACARPRTPRQAAPPAALRRNARAPVVRIE
jgi:hypothetical protein